MAKTAKKATKAADTKKSDAATAEATEAAKIAAKAAEAEKAKATAEAKKADADKAKADAKAKRDAEAAKEKAATDAKKAKNQAQADKMLPPLAKEFRERMVRANRDEIKADDHRTAAAIQLAKAKELCGALGQNFKQWAIANISDKPLELEGGKTLQLSYEVIRKYVVIGAAPDPLAAMAEARAKNALANKEHREIKKLTGAGKKAAKAGKSPTVLDRANAPAFKVQMVDALKQLPDTEVAEVVGDRAKALGLKLVPLAQAVVAEAPVGDGLAALQAAFNAAAPSTKMQFLNWAAATIGASLVLEPVEVAEADLPSFLKR